MKSPDTLLIRADASAEIGTGHVMRCMALAQAWREYGGEVDFACAACPEALAARLEKEGIGISLMWVAPGGTQDIDETIKLAQRRPTELAVVDGYHFGSGYISRLKAGKLKVLEIDDCAPSRFWNSDWLLNQNIYARQEMYSQHSESTRFLLGPRYAMLRREFWRWRGIKRETRSIGSRILVTLGGGDPANLTSRILEELSGLIGKGLQIVILIGAANPHLRKLQDAVNKIGSAVRLEINIQDMGSLMNWADLAITSGGSTCWETAFMGLPSLVLILADNQKDIAESLGKEEISINLGSPSEIDWQNIPKIVLALIQNQEKRDHMSKKGQLLVDGWGVERILSTINAQ